MELIPPKSIKWRERFKEKATTCDWNYALDSVFPYKVSYTDGLLLFEFVFPGQRTTVIRE